MRLVLLFISLLLPALFALGQTGGNSTTEQKHLIYFTDKTGTPYSVVSPLQFLSQKALDRRNRQNIPVISRDLPVNPSYVSRLRQEGVQVVYTSRWFNAAVVQCPPEKLAALQSLPFIRGSQSLNRYSQAAMPKSGVQSIDSLSITAATPEALFYGPAFHQANMLGVPELHDAGYRGEGIAIAVFDAGFPGVNTAGAFGHLFQNGQIKGTYDFVDNRQHVYTHNAHGTAVLSTMAAHEPGLLVGTAYKADYYLFRTEDAATEHNIEEINWLLAAEFADSAGVDIINSSLGYNVFDPPSYSYTYQDLDGNSALVTRAADYAAAVGMLVVVSAGNQGNKDWRYITAPADADSVLAVGAVDSVANHAPFSSFGPTADNRIKPDVVAMGHETYVLSSSGRLNRSSGTSFAGPVVAGMAACLWQANSNLTNMQLLQLIRESGSNATSPNNTIGYGVPKYIPNVTGMPALLNDGVLISNPVTEQFIVLTLSESWQKEPALVQVFDATGKLIHKQTLQANSSPHAITMKPGSLTSGVYLCQITGGGRSKTLRFIKF